MEPWQKLLEGELDDLLPHIEDDLRTGAFEMYKICYSLGRYERYIWLDVSTEDEARARIAKQEGVPEENVRIYWMSKEVGK
jgi:hypothetical protein